MIKTLVWLAASALLYAQGGPPFQPLAGQNASAIALLRWYSVNQTAQFPLPGGGTGVAFDGASIWVAITDSGVVTKLRASDGLLMGIFPVINGPFGIAFDGANMWVTSVTGNTVTKLRASDGTTLGVFTV